MLNWPQLDTLITTALAEDFPSGDVTSDAVVPLEAQGVATAVAKSAQVVCGTSVAQRVFSRVDPGLEFSVLVNEGERVSPGTALWQVRGSARSLLVAERTALNFVQRMGGIATLTRQYVDAVPDRLPTRLTDTRKTTPGLRALERYAVRMGGGHNHRDNLSTAVLIKDNHIAAAGGVRVCIERARQWAPHTSKIEVEVSNLEMLEEALQAGADVVMLDNFADETVRQAVGMVVTAARARAVIEVSGNVGLERVAELARAGVDVISVGALTHSAPAADISLRVELQ